MRKAASTNYWMNRVETEPLDVIPPKKRRLDREDYLYAGLLFIVWLASVYVIGWKTLPGGLPMLPTFLILEGLFTTMVTLAWVKTRD